MKRSFYFATLLCLCLPLMGSAQSGGSSGASVEISLLPVLVNRNDTRSVTTAPGVATEIGFGYDTRTTLGYEFAGRNWLVGLTYNLYSLKTKRGFVEGGDSGLDESTDNTQWGPTIGWLPGNWRLLLTYFTSGKKTVQTINEDASGKTGDVTITNTSLSGFQLSAGYAFQISQQILLGPSLIYRSLTYSKQSKTNALNSFENYEDVSLASAHVEATFDAMFTMVFQF
jgi:hypothetical protein